jgi:hypothetical protein
MWIVQGCWWGILNVGDLEDVGADGSVILADILKSTMGKHGPNSSGSGYGQITDCYEYSDEPSFP